MQITYSWNDARTVFVHFRSSTRAIDAFHIQNALYAFMLYEWLYVYARAIRAHTRSMTLSMHSNLCSISAKKDEWRSSHLFHNLGFAIAPRRLDTTFLQPKDVALRRAHISCFPRTIGIYIAMRQNGIIPTCQVARTYCTINSYIYCAAGKVGTGDRTKQKKTLGRALLA